MSFGGFLKQSTAVNVIIGPFVSSTDGDTEMTALTIAQADVRLSKNAGADAQKNDATSCAHEGDGFYMCELDATDTNTVGLIDLWVHVATALAIHRTYQVLEEAIYDALFASGAAVVPANVTQWLGTAAATPTVAGVPEVDLTHVAGSTTSVSALASGVATLLADWLNGGRLDLILDIIAADTTTDIPALIAALNDLDAAGIRTALGMASADLDSQLDVLVDNNGLLQELGAHMIMAVASVGATGNDVTHVHLDGQTFEDGQLNDLLISILGSDESREYFRWIEDWTLSTELATVKALPFTPNTSDVYTIYKIKRSTVGVVRQNTCQTDGSPDSTHAVLDAGASANDDVYNNLWFKVVKGTGSTNQPRAITGYVGATKRVTLDPPLDTNVDNTSEFAIFT